MKQVLLLLSVTTLLFSCSTMMMGLGNSYKYKYELTKPIPDASLNYEDDKMSFKFIVGEKEIDFTAKNKTEQPLKIIWDEASLVLNGSAEKIMHKGVKYIDRSSSTPPTTIPGNAYIDELAVPVSNVSYSTYGSGWNTSDLFPTSDLNKESYANLIKSKVGSDFTLYLPVKDITGKEIGYSFVFKIADVQCINCKTATPKK